MNGIGVGWINKKLTDFAYFAEIPSYLILTFANVIIS